MHGDVPYQDPAFRSSVTVPGLSPFTVTNFGVPCSPDQLSKMGDQANERYKAETERLDVLMKLLMIVGHNRINYDAIYDAINAIVAKA